LSDFVKEKNRKLNVDDYEVNLSNMICKVMTRNKDLLNDFKE